MTKAKGDALDVLRNAIEMELEGKDFFERAIGIVKHQRAKDTFSGLVKQEQRHVEVLGAELARLERGKDWLSLNQLETSGESYPKLSVFRDKAIKRIKIDPGTGELDVLGLGIEIERKSIKYYEDAGRAVRDGNAREMFAWLVKEESGHLAILTAEYDYRSKSGYYYDNAEFSLEVM